MIIGRIQGTETGKDSWFQNGNRITVSVFHTLRNRIKLSVYEWRNNANDQRVNERIQ